MSFLKFLKNIFTKKEELIIPQHPPVKPNKGKVYLYWNRNGTYAENAFSFVDNKEVIINSIKTLDIGIELKEIIIERVEELSNMIETAPTYALIACGGILEGILYGLAQKYPKQFNCQKKGEHVKFEDWSLNDYLQAVNEMGLVDKANQVFSVILRDYRNFIHPQQELKSKEPTPSKETVQLCCKAMENIIVQICKNVYKLSQS